MTQHAMNIEDAGISAAFLRNHRGEVCIAFSDPSYVRADAIWIDEQSLAVHAIIHHASHLIGNVSEGMMQAFKHNNDALLTAVRPDGTILELRAPIQGER